MQIVSTALTFGKRGVNIMSYKISDTVENLLSLEDAELVQQLDKVRMCLGAFLSNIEINGVWTDIYEKSPDESGMYLVAIEDPGSDAQVVLTAWYDSHLPTALVPTPIKWTLLNEFYPFTYKLQDMIRYWKPFPLPPED